MALEEVGADCPPKSTTILDDLDEDQCLAPKASSELKLLQEFAQANKTRFAFWKKTRSDSLWEQIEDMDNAIDVMEDQRDVLYEKFQELQELGPEALSSDDETSDSKQCNGPEQPGVEEHRSEETSDSNQDSLDGGEPYSGSSSEPIQMGGVTSLS